MSPTVAWSRFSESLILVAIGEQAILDDEWTQYTTFLASCYANGDVPGILISTLGGSPNSIQRKRLVDEVASTVAEPARVAMLTDSKITRGVLTALGWLSDRGRLKAFPLADYDTALDHLCSDAPRLSVQSVINGLISEVSAPQSPQKHIG